EHRHSERDSWRYRWSDPVAEFGARGRPEPARGAVQSGAHLRTRRPKRGGGQDGAGAARPLTARCAATAGNRAFAESCEFEIDPLLWITRRDKNRISHNLTLGRLTPCAHKACKNQEFHS